MNEPTPLAIDQQDFTALRKLTASWIEEVKTGEVDENLEHYIYEAAMEAIYGPDVWKWVNEQDYDEF